MVALEFIVYNNHATLVLGATPSQSRVITSNKYIVGSSCYNYNIVRSSGLHQSNAAIVCVCVGVYFAVNVV